MLTYLGAGVDVNRQSDDGETALTRACQLGLQEIISLLIASGADVNLPTDSGKRGSFLVI